MSSSLVSRGKCSDDRTKCIISGYLRQQFMNISIDIPSILQYLMIAFYWIEEKFVECGDYLSIDESERKVITRIRRDEWVNSLWCTVYTNNTIEANDESIIKYSWSFKYINKSSYRMSFGVVSSKNKILNNIMRTGAEKYHLVCLNGYVRNRRDKDETNEKHYKFDAKGLKNEGILNLMLNIKTKELRFGFDEDYDKYLINFGGPIEFDIKYKFKFAISLSLEPGEQVELCKFNVMHR